MVNQSGGLCSVTWSRCKPSFSHRVTKLSHASLRFQHWLAFASHARDFLLSQARVWLIDSSRFKRSISCSGPRCLSCDFRLSRLIATQGSSENVVYVRNEPSKCIALFVLALAARYLRYHKSQVLTRKNTLINVHIKFLLIKLQKCYRYKWLCTNEHNKYLRRVCPRWSSKILIFLEYLEYFALLYLPYFELVAFAVQSVIRHERFPPAAFIFIVLVLYIADEWFLFSAARRVSLTRGSQPGATFIAYNYCQPRSSSRSFDVYEHVTIVDTRRDIRVYC